MLKPPRIVRLFRERDRLDKIARERGYENSNAMIADLYDTQRMSIEKIAKSLFTPIWTLRKRFDELGINVKTRGGRNNVKFEVTKELYNEACRDGVLAVADRVGVDPATVELRLRKWFKENKQ